MIQKKYYPWLLLLLSIVFFFPFLGNVHLFDWDEINFAESAREMLVTGDYYRVRINYEPFWEKPPFFFWLQALSMKLFGVNEFAARFPNAICGVFTVMILFNLGKKHVNETFGFIWGVIYLGAFLPHLYFKSGIIDPIFNLFIFLGIYFLAKTIDTSQNRKYFPIVSGIFIGLAIITKGPVGLLLLLLTFSVYLIVKKFKVKINLIDVLLFALSSFIVTSIWFGYEVIQNGPWFIIEFIKYQIELFSEPVAGHAQPFYYHFIVVLLGCFPMSIFAIGAFKKYNEEVPFDLLKWMKILFWVVLILFSIVETKIVHYSSMTYLPLSFIATFYLYQLYTNKIKLNKGIKIGFITLGSIFSILLVLTPILFFNKEFLASLIKDKFAQASLDIDMGWTGFEFIVGLIYPLGIIISIWLYRKNKKLESISSLSIFAGLSLFGYALFIVPKIERFSQGPAIDFLISKQSEDAYITTIGHKSYAHYFYGRVKPSKENDGVTTIKTNYENSLSDPKDYNVIELNNEINHWLLTGEIDKNAYFVTKSTRKLNLDEYKDIQEIDQKGGFVFYERKVKAP